MFNKAGEERTLDSIAGFTIVLAIAGILFYSLYTLEDEAKLNKIKAEDVALILDTADIPEGDFELNYELKDRRIDIDKDRREINLFKEDRTKEGEAEFSSNVEGSNEAVGSLHVVKRGDRVEAT
jgi:cytochrome c biogenesis factor